MMETIFAFLGGAVVGVLVAAWRPRGDDTLVGTIRRLGGGPRPTVPK